MIPERHGSAAIAWSIAQHREPTADWEGLCLKFTRSCFGVPAKYRSANAAYAHARLRRPAGGPVAPAGVPVWWSGGKWGHVALSAGGGFCWSNDIRRTGQIDKVAIDTIAKAWRGFRYLGWSADINGHVVWTPPANPPIPATVSLLSLATAFRADPGRPQGKGLHPGDVRPVEDALRREGLLDDRWAFDGYAGTLTVRAYARWQGRCGFKGPQADGIPGKASLTKLSARHPELFVVTR